MTTQRPTGRESLDTAFVQNEAVANPQHPVLQLTELEHISNRIAGLGNAEQLAAALLQQLGIESRIEGDQLQRIPQRGAVIFVCNQSFGTVESLALFEQVRKRRPDLAVFANMLLSSFTALHDAAFFVDPGWRLASRVRNVLSLKAAMRAVADGRAVGPLPTDDTALFDHEPWQVVDPTWRQSVTSVLLGAGATVVPVAFTGNEGALSGLSNLLSPHVAGASPGQEKAIIRIEIGSPLKHVDLDSLQPVEKAASLLRERSQSLRMRDREERRLERATGNQQPVAEAGPSRAVANEIASLPESQRLVTHKGRIVAYSRGDQCPALLDEIGRLRQIAFRAVGEGTDAPRDLDAFDDIYDHLFVWNEETEEVIGAYRLGRINQLGGEPYCSTLFDIEEGFFPSLGSALELGRSFVRPEYQRSPAGLIMLWKGIGQYVDRHPEFRYLLGPVSISADYGLLSKQLMVRFMELNHGAGAWDGQLRPRTPFDPEGDRNAAFKRYGRFCSDIADTHRFISHLERDGKGIPVLVKSYLQLGGRMLAFNVDEDFGACVDGLVLVDLTKTKLATLEQFMGEESAHRFLRMHGAKP